MPVYGDLILNNHSLIREKENGDIHLVDVVMITNHSILLFYRSLPQTYIWKKKEDTLHEIIETLSFEQVMTYDQIVSEEDDWNFDDDDDEDDDDNNWDFGDTYDEKDKMRPVR